MSVARPKIVNHQVKATTLSFLIWQSFILGDIEKELHETPKQRRAKVVDVLSGPHAVAVLRPEEDVAERLWMGSAELNQASACWLPVLVLSWPGTPSLPHVFRCSPGEAMISLAIPFVARVSRRRPAAHFTETADAVECHHGPRRSRRRTSRSSGYFSGLFVPDAIR